MKLKTLLSLSVIFAIMFCILSGCAKDVNEKPSTPAPQLENDIDKPTAAGGDDASGIFCGDYSVPEEGEMDGDYSVVSSQIHLPNQEVDGEVLAESSAAAPLKEDYKPDYATSELTESEQEEATRKYGEISDGYTLTYGCVATKVASKESTEKMKAFLTETCKYWCLVDWVKKPEATCTVELGGNRYSLVEYYMVENLESGGGAYILNCLELEAFRSILQKEGILADSIDSAIDKAIKNVGEAYPLSGTPKDDSAEGHTHAPAKTPRTVSDPITGYCGNMITKIEKDGDEVSFWGGDSVNLTDLVINLEYSQPMCKCAEEFLVYVETEKEPYEVNLSQNFVRFGDKHASLTAEQTKTIRKIYNNYFPKEGTGEIIIEKPLDIPASSPAQLTE